MSNPYRSGRGGRRLVVDAPGAFPVASFGGPRMKRHYTTQEKREILAMADSLGSVAQACRRAGMSRSTFYALKSAYEKGGEEALRPKPRKSPRMPNAFSHEVVQRILEVTRVFPSYSCTRISVKLRESGVVASGSGVRKVWMRHGLTEKEERIRRFRQSVANGDIVVLSDQLVSRK